jgi:hypothetical protein
MREHLHDWAYTLEVLPQRREHSGGAFQVSGNAKLFHLPSALTNLDCTQIRRYTFDRVRGAVRPIRVTRGYCLGQGRQLSGHVSQESACDAAGQVLVPAHSIEKIFRIKIRGRRGRRSW